jgi:hypothetical protein
MRTANRHSEALSEPVLAIHVFEPGVRPNSGSLRCKIGEHIEFSTASLESYFFAKWEPRRMGCLARCCSRGIRR